MSELVLIYVPITDQKTGQLIAHRMLEKKLVACANIFAPHLAIYEMNGGICEDDESVVIFKTTKEKLHDAMEALKNLHPYNCPCITTIETGQTHQPFMDWVEKQTETPRFR